MPRPFPGTHAPYRGAARWALLLLLPWLFGCGGETALEVPPLEPPKPRLEGLEEPVVEALQGARQRVIVQPTSASAWGSYGLSLHAHELVNEAVTCYRQAARLAPTDSRWPYLAGLALRTLAPNEALEEMARAETLEPRLAAFYVQYGDTLLQAAEPEQAKQRYERALQIAPQMAFAHFGLARVALLKGELPVAEQHLRDALEQRQAYREAHTLLAQVLQRSGDSEGARLHTWKATNYPDSAAPEDPVYEQVAAAGRSAVWAVRRGLAAAGAKRYEVAEKELRYALEVRGDNATDLAYLGGVLAASGRSAEAMETYRRALALDASSVVAHNNLAQALLQQGDLQTAEEHLRQALSLDPNNREAQLNLGLILGRQGQLAESRQHLESLLQQSPGDVEALQLMAPLALQMGFPDSALELWQRLLAIQPSHLESLEQLVRLHVQRGEHEAAIERLQQGLEIAPNSSRLVLFLAWELATAPDALLRDGARAVQLAQRVRAAYPEQYQPADVLAAAHAEQGDFALALREIEAALRLAKASEAPVLEELEARRAGYARGQPHRQQKATESIS